MDTTIHSDSTLFTGLLQPLFSALPRCRHSRSCPSLSDPDWLALGTLRVLLDHGSGRGFLQHMLAHHQATPSTALFFENLGSQRRLRLCAEASALLRRQASADLPDAFASHTLLENFDIFAGDGSYLVAACHDRPQPSSSAASGHKKFATGHFFGMDLRTSALFHLAVADQIERRQEHDVRAVKKLDPEVLRQGAPKGRKVLWAWDRAITDLLALVRSRGIELRKHGAKDFVGRCPFHDDNDSPNFIVSPAKGLFHCMACGAAGNPIQFVEKFDGVSFRHAFELLNGGKAAFENAPSKPVKQATVPKLPCPLDLDADDGTLLDQVADYYHERLRHNRPALDYLAGRGLDDEELVRRFRIGFADRTLGLRLPEKNRREGAAIRERLQELGVFRKESGHEHFNGSVVFPILNGNGQE